MVGYSLVEHRNGTLYVLVNRSQPLSEADRRWLIYDLKARTGRQVIGVANTFGADQTFAVGHTAMTGFRTDGNIQAFRQALASNAHPLRSDLDLSHPTAVIAQVPYYLNAGHFQMLQVQEPRSEAMAKVIDSIERSYKYMPAQVAEAVRAIFTAQNIALIGATLSVYAMSHFFGIGFILDAILLVVSIVCVGALAADAIMKFVEFYTLATRATTEAELEEAGKLFADVVLTLGVGAITAILTRRSISRSGQAEMDASVARRALGWSPEGNARPQQSIETIRRRVVDLRGNLEIHGPEAVQRGRAVNLTTDVPFVLSKDWDDVFFVAAHATQRSLTFFADYEARVAIAPRALAARIFQAGYRGGDLVLLACESGLNRPLVKAVWSELRRMGLDRPVGTIFAPRRAINGGEIIREDVRDLAWEVFSFNG